MSPSTRALLAAAREGLGPDPAAAARVRAKLDAALAGSAAAAAPAAATGGSVALKLAAVVLVAAGAVAVVTVSQHAAAPTTAPALPLEETARVDVPAPTVHAATLEPAAPPPVKSVVVHSAPPVEAPPPAPPSEVSLAREVQLIDDAMGSLRGGDPTAALAAIAAFHRETGDRGQLLEEATAIEIEASCNLHLDVKTKLATFDRTWPSSAQRARLTAACH